MTTPDAKVLTKRTRRRTFSEFAGLYGLSDAKASDGEWEAGTGSAVLYLRVSDTRQTNTGKDDNPDGNSIATQRKQTMARARRLKVPVVKEFVEPGRSAQSVAKRPVFRELLYYVEDNPDVRYVIIYMHARVFRNHIDAAITRRILRSMGVTLVSVREDYGEGTDAEFMEAITDLFNEMAVRKNGEDISVKMLNRAQDGGSTGRAKLGYLNGVKYIEGQPVKTIDVDPKRGPLVTWAFEQYATGDYSVTRLQQELAEQGFTTRPTAKWKEQPASLSQIGLILRDPYYLGMKTYKGKIYPGKHEALVTPEVFERVQRVLVSRSQRNQRDSVHNHFLRGMLRCDRCSREGRSHQLVYSRVAKPGAIAYEYFLCLGRQQRQCDLPHLPVTLVEDALLRMVESLKLDAREIEAMRTQVQSELDRQLRRERETRARVKSELAPLDGKEERLLDLAEDGSLTSSNVRERLQGIQVKRAALNRRLASTEDYIRQESETLLHYLALLERPGAFYAAASDSVKRKLLAAFFSGIWIDDEGSGISTVGQPQEMVGRIHQTAHAEGREKKGTKSILDASDPSFLTSYFLGVSLSKPSLVHHHLT